MKFPNVKYRLVWEDEGQLRFDASSRSSKDLCSTGRERQKSNGEPPKRKFEKKKLNIETVWVKDFYVFKSILVYIQHVYVFIKLILAISELTELFSNIFINKVMLSENWKKIINGDPVSKSLWISIFKVICQKLFKEIILI